MKSKTAELPQEIMALSDLKPNPKNPNSHPEKQIKILRHLIKTHGYYAVTITIQKSTGLIIKGHGVREALMAEGYDKALVNVKDCSDSEADAILIADNKIASDSVIDNMALNNLISELSVMDVPALDFGFDESDLESLASQILADSGGYQAEPEDDEIPDVVEPITQVGDLWTLGRHRVLCGDSTLAEDVTRLMDGVKAELLFTSPPYSDMRDYNGEIDLSIENLINFISTFEPFVNYQVINLGIQRKDNEIFPYWNAYIDKAKEVGYKLLSWNVWNREGSGFNMSQITAMFAISHEWLFVFGKLRKDLNLTIPNKTAGELSDNSWDRQKDGSLKKAKTHNTRDFRQLSTVETIITEHARIWTKNHPAIFPVALPFRYIEAMTSESDIVCDCFGGSGTTLIASEQLKRRSFLMEIDQHYCDVIVKRYIDFVGSSEGVFCDRQGQKIAYSEVVKPL